MSTQQEAARHPVNPVGVNTGDLMAFTYYGFVSDKNLGGDVLTIQGLDGVGRFEVRGANLVSSGSSADFVAEERKVSRTDVADALVSSAGKPFTVCFIKKDGEERILKGRFIRQDRLMGRSLVEDMQRSAEDSDPIRQVCHRTLQWLICDGVKYIVK